MNRHIKQGKLKEDLFESKRTPDPILAKKDIREQKLLEAHIINSSAKHLKCLWEYMPDVLLFRR